MRSRSASLFERSKITPHTITGRGVGGKITSPWAWHVLFCHGIPQASVRMCHVTTASLFIRALFAVYMTGIAMSGLSNNYRPVTVGCFAFQLYEHPSETIRTVAKSPALIWNMSDNEVTQRSLCSTSVHQTAWKSGLSHGNERCWTVGRWIILQLLAHWVRKTADLIRCLGNQTLSSSSTGVHKHTHTHTHRTCFLRLFMDARISLVTLDLLCTEKLNNSFFLHFYANPFLWL